MPIAKKFMMTAYFTQLTPRLTFHLTMQGAAKFIALYETADMICNGANQ